jgi:hypothetical protein
MAKLARFCLPDDAPGELEAMTRAFHLAVVEDLRAAEKLARNGGQSEV